MDHDRAVAHRRRTMTAPVSSGACRACNRHRELRLVELGVSTSGWDLLIALAGNPNTGKSTVFNALTGLRQHTGNWPGKTVTRAEGVYRHDGTRVKVIDLPGTYSLQAGSRDEEVARDFVLFGRPDVTVIVVDATRLERNLNLVLQILETTDRAVVCLNLMDEATRHGISVSPETLGRELGVPVVPTTAHRGKGIPALRAAIHEVATGAIRPAPFRMREVTRDIEAAAAQLSPLVADLYPEIPNARWVALRLLHGDERVEVALESGELGVVTTAPEGQAVLAPHTPDATKARTVLDAASSLRWKLDPHMYDAWVARIYREAQRIANVATLRGSTRRTIDLDRSLDRVLTSRVLGFPIMLLVLAVVLWITVVGANAPSQLLSALLVDTGHAALRALFASVGAPGWLTGVLVDGMYLATAWVVSVMLPPMAIFFPLFTLLEDFGYLPRVAFNLDGLFYRVGAHGKQALTMCMGFGCNAAGVVSTRVIDSPRERLIAIVTNNFSLCNGRWPTQILIGTIFIGALAPPHWSAIVAAAAVVTVALLGIGIMFGVSWLLSHTMLRGEATTFSLELPPYRPPRIFRTLYTSLIDRTLIVLWRAVLFAMPAGAVIWLVSNVAVGGASVATHVMSWFDPFGLLIGLNGVILLAYVVAIPANEIVIPTILMLTVLTLGATGVGEGSGVMFELASPAVGDLLRAGGWTLLTGINLMLFSLLHNPCSTTLYTIFQETKSARWTAISALLPLTLGFALCFLVTQVWRLVQ